MGEMDGRIVGVTKIVDHGRDARRFNIVLVAEGYQAGQLGQFAQDAAAFVNALSGREPFERLMGGINVHRLDVESTDAGADEPTACGGSGATPRTFFDATFCDGGVARRLVVDDERVVAAVDAHVPAWHAILVVVNSTTYGGTGGTVGTYSLAPDAMLIALHELGHVAFDLADEYSYFLGCGLDTDRDHHPASEPDAPNVTIDGNRDTIKWRDLVTPLVPMPTSTNPDCTACDERASAFGSGTVGAFEGGNTFHCGVFRPEHDCMMRTLGLPFCAVCRRVITERLAAFQPPALLQASWKPGTNAYHHGLAAIPRLEVLGQPADADRTRWSMLHDGTTYRYYCMREGRDDRLYPFGYRAGAYRFGYDGLPELALEGFPADADASSFAMLHDGSRYRLYLRRAGDPTVLYQATWVPGTARYVFGHDGIAQLPVIGFPADTDWSRWTMLHDGHRYRLSAFRQGIDTELYQGAYHPLKQAYEYGYDSIAHLVVVGTPADADRTRFGMLHDGTRYRLYFQTR